MQEIHLTTTRLRARKEENEKHEAEVEEEPSQAFQVIEREEPVPEARPGKQAGASIGTNRNSDPENAFSSEILAEKHAQEGTVK